MTFREMFDKMRTHLLAQNAKSQLPNSSVCAYRGQNGTKCAVGCLIPDEAYDPKIENLNVNVQAVFSLIPGYEDLTSMDRNRLDRVQRIHDFAEVEQWPEQLSRVARDMGIE